MFLSELTAAGQVYRAVAGDAPSFEIVLNGDGLSDAAYCRRLVAGEIPNVIHDAATDARVSELPATRQAQIGCFIGCPCGSRTGRPTERCAASVIPPDHTLDERDVRFMSMLGDLIVQDLDEQRTQERLHTDLMRLVDTERVDVAFQPIMDLRKEQCIGIEALARFPKPFGAPDLTLAAAKAVGLGLELERLAIRRAWKIIPRLGRDSSWR